VRERAGPRDSRSERVCARERALETAGERKGETERTWLKKIQTYRMVDDDVAVVDGKRERGREEEREG